MFRGFIWPLSALTALGYLVPNGQGGEPAPYNCAAMDDYFAAEVWAKVGAGSCLKCHKAGGDAEESKFLLRDPQKAEPQALAEIMQGNRAAFTEMARVREEGGSRLLLKSIGKLKHEGEEVVAPDSSEYRVLAEFVRRLDSPSDPPPVTTLDDPNAPPFFEGITMVEDRKLLRRVALSLAGRLPTQTELDTIAQQGLPALPALLDAIMKEEAFYDRLREGFNDIFLTLGYPDNAETLLSYDHFEKTRGWCEKFDLNHIPEAEDKRQKARYKLYDDYRKALLGEPMKLIEHIVRNDHPFTEILTADYVMVTPFSARGYGIFEDIKSQFKNPDDPFEYIPVKLKALIGRDKVDDQESATGFYPHAGLLSSFQYLRRYPTTETNRNRLRARMYFQHFLGIDVLELAARVSDAAAVSAKYEIPTMQASECVVCHKTIDPVAGLFQDYWKFEGVYGRRKEGWFTDMFGAGFEGEDLPAEQRWRSLQWLGERTTKDPRFAVAMVEHVYYLLTGRKVLLPPKDLNDPLYESKRRAYQTQRRQTKTISTHFAQAGFNLKTAVKDWAVSEFYRADGLATEVGNPQRRAELDDIGMMRMLSPEQIERKIAAIFGKPWGELTDQMAMLYGGIDSNEVTERAADPSGAMGALQRILANDVACKQTAVDFARPAAERRLFPEVEPDVLPGSSPEADARIRKNIVHLHQRVLGRYDAPDSPEVDRAFQLFAGILSDAASRKDPNPQENYFCRRDLPNESYADPQYTVRAWRAVLTYLLRQREFLYE